MNRKLHITKTSKLSDVETGAWKAALEKAVNDPSVGIRHASVVGNEAYRIHVAGISDKVGAHYHSVGDEDYTVVLGEGALYWGPVVDDESPKVPFVQAVKEGDHFVIPEGYAHQLKNTGRGELVILFGCPDAHLDDLKDRHLLEDLTL